MTTTDLSLSLIRTDGGTQMRVEISEDVYTDYRDKWKSGEEFDPIDVFYDGTTYWLADGFHRFYGAREARMETIPAKVHKGTRRDAILFACGANARHGLRRTNADKRKAVETLLDDPEWVQWSDNKIAEEAAVSVQTVSNIRSQLSKIDSSPAAKVAGKPRVGKDGKARKPPKKKPTPEASPKQQVSDFFDGKESDQEEVEEPAIQKPKPGKPKNDYAKFGDSLLLHYISPLVRGIDQLAEKLGGKGEWHAKANDALNSLIDAIKQMKGGKK